MIDRHHGWNASLKPVFLGLLLSVIILFALYKIVLREHLSGELLKISVLGLTLILAIIHLVLFMHVGMESKPHWVSISLIFTVVVILIVIGGSVWIMNNLNYNLMPMTQTMPKHGSF